MVGKLGYREWTALVEAAMEGHEGCVRLLLHCGAGKKVQSCTQCFFARAAEVRIVQMHGR